VSNSAGKSEAAVLPSGEDGDIRIRLEIVEISHLAVRSGRQAREEIRRWFDDVAKQLGSIVIVPTDQA
jgi:hypothetical protein